MGFLEDKISPFSNLKTVTTVLDSDGLTQNMGSVTFYSCGSCTVETEFLCLVIHNYFAVGSAF